MNPEKNKSLNQRIEWGVAILITFVAVYLHWLFLSNAGGLWRDESGAVQLATLPKLGETLSNLGHESSPVFFPAAIRSWVVLGFGGTDFGLRVYGFLTGVFLLTAVWFSSWMLTRSVPLISLGLLAVNLTVIRWGDSLRAYGTGSVLMLVAIASMWCFIKAPNRIRWLLAGLAAMCSVQCLFQNAFLVLAICIAGCAVCVWRKDMRCAVAVLAIGMIAAVSLLPYLQIVRKAQDWSVLSQTGFMPGHAWQNLSDALALSALWTKWLWVGLVLLIIFRWTKILGNKTVGKENAETPVFYASTALVTGIIAFLIYLWIAALPTQVWYYLPLMTFTAVCADAALQNWLTRWRIWRLLFACLIVGASFSGTLQMSQCRQTNVDLVVAELNERIEPNDLILVHPWYYGISFERYYKGKTPWTTLPPLEDYRFHRYDLFKVQMQMDDPIQPVLDKIAATLKSGNRVWLVGQIPLNPLPPPNLRPAPNNPWGWLDEPYSHIWGAQAGYFIANHAIQGTIITEHSVNCISPYENLPLILITGWR